MNNQNDVLKDICNFLGWGNPNANVWFVGLEEHDEFNSDNIEHIRNEYKNKISGYKKLAPLTGLCAKLYYLITEKKEYDNSYLENEKKAFQENAGDLFLTNLSIFGSATHNNTSSLKLKDKYENIFGKDFLNSNYVQERWQHLITKMKQKERFYFCLGTKDYRNFQEKMKEVIIQETTTKPDKLDYKNYTIYPFNNAMIIPHLSGVKYCNKILLIKSIATYFENKKLYANF